MKAVSHITWPKAYVCFNWVSLISLLLLKVMELCCFFLRQLARMLATQTSASIYGFLGGSLEGEISKDGKTDAVSLGKAEVLQEASNVLVSVETEEA